MIRKLFALTFCMGSVAAYAQQQDVAIITAKLDKSPNDTLVNLYEPYSGDTATAVIKNHQFKMTMPIAKGGSVYIMQIGSNPELGGTLVYLEKGKMNITGKGGYFKDATFSGDAWVKEWQEVMNLTAPDAGDGKALADLEQKYRKAMEVGDEDAAEEYNKQGAILQKKQKDVLGKWMQEHRNSGVTGYVMTIYFNTQREMDSLYAGLGEHAKASRILQRWKNPGKVDPSIVNVKVGAEGEAPGTPGSVKIGGPAPAFSIPDMDGKMVSLADFKGKYVFVDFWASWCGPCKPQIPFLKAANDKFKNSNFVMLGISLDSKKEAWVKAVAKHELNWLNLSSLKGWGDATASAYGASYIPFNVLIGPDGNIVARNLYGEEVDKKLSELMPQAALTAIPQK
ncbi:TlpA disulfide reductase family protein [Chitinophaga arvensicola]|uniref:Peroxiredoxin n=1 Tax=Chitinophaga arvensicola TaxID=29529 RepID=A0A1I0S6P9_9BACT|nr:TlpA disulfide reductase family protein [Chitinophaga arvensicola]SEW51074.1 Peroxiredoxin [Chitinophaga arvensicola]